MAPNVLEREVNILIKARDLASFKLLAVDKATGKLNKTNQKLYDTEKRNLDLNKTQLAIAKKAESIQKQRTANLKAASGAMLGFGLSALFTGMAIKNFAQQMLQGLGKTFMSMTDNTNAAHRQITNLQAAFVSLKFTIFNTLSQTELFKSIVNSLIEGANAMGRWTAQNPAFAKFLGIALSVGIVLGGTLMIIGQMVLGIVGIVAGFQVFSGLTGAAGAAAAAGSTVGLGAVLSTLGLIALAIVAIWVAWETNFIGFEDSAKESANGLLKIWEGTAKDYGIIIDGMSLAMDGFVEADSKKFVTGIGNMFKALADVAIITFGNIMILFGNMIVNSTNAMIGFIEKSLNLSIDAVNVLRSKMGKEKLDWEVDLSGELLKKFDYLEYGITPTESPAQDTAFAGPSPYRKPTDDFVGPTRPGQASEPTPPPVVDNSTTVYNFNGSNITDTEGFIAAMDVYSEFKDMQNGTPIAPTGR